MATRMLAFAMLVLAFANPYIPAALEGGAQSGWASVYLDNSPSMQSGEGVNSALNLARTKAVEIVKALPDNYRIQILTNDFSGKQQRFYTKGEAVSLIDEAEISYASRTAEEVIDRVNNAHENVKAEKLEVFWISDFQKSVFNGAPDWPEDWTKTVLPLTRSNNFGNLSIDSVWFDQPVLQAGFDQELFVQLKNSGGEVSKKAPVSITLDGNQIGTREMEIPAEGKVTTSFILRPAAAKAYHGMVKVGSNDPGFDNSFHFSYNVDKPFQILLTGSNERLNKYERLYQDSIYKLNYVSTEALDYATISGYDLFIIDAPENLPSGLIQAIETELSNGKNGVIFPQEGDPTQTNNLLAQLGILPLGNIQDASTVLDANWEDPIFKNVFSSIPSNPSLPEAQKNYAYPASQGYPLLTLSNGSPLVSRIPVGQGNLIISTSPLTQTNLSSQAIFVPIMLNAALYSRNITELYTLSGKPKGPSFAGTENTDIPLEIHSETKSLIPRQRTRGEKIEVYDIPASLPPGAYEVIQNEQKAGYLALNTNPRESKWHFYTEEEISDLFGLQSSDILEASAGSIDYTIQQRYQGTPLWKIFLAAALLFLIIEIVIIKLWK